MTPVNVDGSILKMKAFPFSLLEKAKDWLYELAPGTVTSWESMKRAFLEKFFPTSRVILLPKRISGIQQNQGESFPTYYKHFKTLVASCPQHQMKEELLLQYFYKELLPIESQMLDASAREALVDKTPMAAKTLIANRALNAQQYEGVGQRANPRQQQVNKVSVISELQNQMANLTTLLSQVVEKPKEQSVATCGVCSMNGHLTDKCPQLIENGRWESANAVGFGSQNQPRNDPFSNTYNPGKLPSSTDVNPKEGFESAKAITLRSGQEVGSDPSPSKSNQKEDEKMQSEEKEQGMPSARIEQSLPQPPTHPNSTTKGNTRFESAMLDLGASINVMPYSIYASMNLGELKNDGVIIQLANRSNAYPKGVLEDVLVQEFLDDLNEDALEKTLTQSIGLKNKGLALRHAHGNNKKHLAVLIQEELVEMVAALESNPRHIGKSPNPISIPISTNKLLPSVIQPFTLELKPLPSHLKYVFLGEQETLPIIISSSLTAQKEDKLVLVIKYAKKCKTEHFRAKLSWNGVYAYGAQGMDKFEGQRSLRNEEMKVKNKEFRIGNQSF
ncbi:unnamed protein product [Malus baccata var. baccata]